MDIKRMQVDVLQCVATRVFMAPVSSRMSVPVSLDSVAQTVAKLGVRRATGVRIAPSPVRAKTGVCVSPTPALASVCPDGMASIAKTSVMFIIMARVARRSASAKSATLVTT